MDHGPHCPFLNRADARCSNYFSLERLGHAFAYCFDEYPQCPVYRELLVERRVRRLMGSAMERERSDGTHPLIQITLHGRPAPAGADRNRQRAA